MTTSFLVFLIPYINYTIRYKSIDLLHIGDNNDIMNIGSLFVLAYTVLTVVAIVLLISDNRDSETTLAWILIIFFVPYLGLPLYYFFGRNWYKSSRRRKFLVSGQRELTKYFSDFRKKYDKDNKAFLDKESGSIIEKVSKLSSTLCGDTLSPATKVDILPSGKEKFKLLKQELADAKKFIVLQYFIWEKDKLTGEIFDILVEKLKENIEVYIMYDFIGSISFSKVELRRLKQLGAKVTADVTNLNMLNYRNHRKVAIIDGRIAYTGGINMGQEYIDGGKRFPTWRDDAIRVEGPVVSVLLALFAIRLFERKKINLFNNKYFPLCDLENKKEIFIQTIFSSVDSSKEAIVNIYAYAMINAKERVWLQSPYFVPNPHLNESMKSAAQGGVDVKLMITGWPDKRIPWYAAFSYFNELIEAGVKVYLYEKGFLHAKMATFDKQFFSLGTTNLDYRSFSLHDEQTLLVFNKELTKKNDLIYENDLKNCRQITLEELKKIGRLKRFRNSICRLFSKVI
ncbi:MAG: cardiolipin synthase [Patescibacteria group bacterium]|nr:cardiolipin synthase [Patescibacteria group bacterium]